MAIFALFLPGRQKKAHGKWPEMAETAISITAISDGWPQKPLPWPGHLRKKPAKAAFSGFCALFRPFRGLLTPFLACFGPFGPKKLYAMGILLAREAGMKWPERPFRSNPCRNAMGYEQKGPFRPFLAVFTQKTAPEDLHGPTRGSQMDRNGPFGGDAIARLGENPERIFGAQPTLTAHVEAKEMACGGLWPELAISAVNCNSVSFRSSCIV